MDPLAGKILISHRRYEMASKSKAQRAFLIKVVADSDFAKSRKMSQDVARDILNDDEEHIAKDKHWADKLPDRAGHSMESRDHWHNPEFIDLIVDQQVHPSFESLTDKFKAFYSSVVGVKATQPKPTAPVVKKIDYDLLYPGKEPRTTKTGSSDFSSLAAALRMKQTPTPFWPNVIKQVDEYVKSSAKYIAAVNKYTTDCERIYKRCESMKPAEAKAYADTEMRKVGARAPDKPMFPLADFTYNDGKYGETHGHPVMVQLRGPVVGDYPTQQQLMQLMTLGRELFERDDPYEHYWTLDDTDEIKWWDHHFPGESEQWGPMLNHFPFAGSVKGFDASALSRSYDLVISGIISIVEVVSVPKGSVE